MLASFGAREEKPPAFFQSCQKRDPDRKQALSQSQKVYGDKACALDYSCAPICASVFSLAGDQRDCARYPAPQAHQFEKLYDRVLKRDLDLLKEISAFDLKVFLNVSLEPLARSFKSLDLVSAKIFLQWIAGDWEIAKTISEEDCNFLFLEIFLNELHVSPIKALREEVAAGRTFIQLAWLKQNDFALAWLDNYFEETQCGGFSGEEAQKCVRAQYCRAGAGHSSDIWEEIMDFKNVRQILNQGQTSPSTNFRDFCRAFCSSKQGQKYCGDFV